MLHLVTDGFFDIVNLGLDIHPYICAVFPFITALFSEKDLLINIFPITNQTILCCTTQQHKNSQPHCNTWIVTKIEIWIGSLVILNNWISN